MPDNTTAPHPPCPDFAPEEAPHAGPPENTPAPVSLQELPLPLQEAVARAGWTSLTPVQSQALPYLLKGRDLMVQARTGSGKTAVYLLPALERLKAREPVCQCLILTPTRELALQVEQVARMLFDGTAFRVAAVYGGVGYGRQMEALREGAHVVVGTPGRILDHLLRRTLNLRDLGMLVFDEADRMLSIGFYPDMKAIQSYLPGRHVPAHFFSATYPPHVLRLAGEFLLEPQLLSLSQKEVHIAGIEHAFYQVRPMEKDRVLVRVLEMENPASAIIFCNTKSNVHYVAGVLQGFGYNADELSADLSQSKREEVLTRLRRGDIRFLVATDVAARGIDIPDLSHVILYEPPEDHESYIHRAGRTARAGAGGTVISLVDIMQKMELDRIARQYKISLSERPTPGDADLAAVVGNRLTAILEGRMRGTASGLVRERWQRFLPLVQELASDEETSLLLAMLLDDVYQKNLHPALPGSQTARARPAAAAEADADRGEKKRRRRPRRPGGDGGETAHG
jgi:ATP-dependent RNA helicase DeaD